MFISCGLDPTMPHAVPGNQCMRERLPMGACIGVVCTCAAAGCFTRCHLEGGCNQVFNRFCATWRMSASCAAAAGDNFQCQNCSLQIHMADYTEVAQRALPSTLAASFWAAFSAGVHTSFLPCHQALPSIQKHLCCHCLGNVRLRTK